MNARHRKTLTAIYATPTLKNITFRNMAALLAAVGCTMKQREGSRVEFRSGRFEMHLHEPHPGKEIKPYQVKRARQFLIDIGVKP